MRPGQNPFISRVPASLSAAAVALLSVVLGASVMAQPRALPDLLRDQAVLTLPGMESVKVDTGLVFSQPGGHALRFDLFHPAGGSSTPAPVVVFVNGVGVDDPPLRRWGIYQSWGRLVAVNGMAAVTHDSRPGSARPDLEALMQHLRANAARYGIDADNMAIWASSANLFHGSWYALNPANTHVKAAVFYYGGIDTTYGRPDLPILVGRAGLDNSIMNSGLDAFVRKELSRNSAITAINLPNGQHGFDLYNKDEASRDVVRSTLAFLKANLSPETQAARRERGPQVRTVNRISERDWDGALSAAAEWLAKEPESGQAFQFRGDACYQLRRYRESAEAYERAASLMWYPGFTRYNAACAWALLGDKESAITSLEAAVSSGFTFDRRVMAADPDFASIKEDPRFRRIVEAQ